MLVQVSGASLTVTLDNVANQNLVLADAVRIVRLTGVVDQNNDAHLQPGSPAIDGGDPATPFLMEPYPNGDRVDIGAYGDTSQATASTNPLIQVLNPRGLAKVQVGSPVGIASALRAFCPTMRWRGWRSAAATSAAPMPTAGAIRTTAPIRAATPPRAGRSI